MHQAKLAYQVDLYQSQEKWYPLTSNFSLWKKIFLFNLSKSNTEKVKRKQEKKRKLYRIPPPSTSQLHCTLQLGRVGWLETCTVHNLRITVDFPFSQQKPCMRNINGWAWRRSIHFSSCITLYILLHNVCKALT